MRLIFFYISIFIVISCSETYNDIPDSGRKIVINGLVTTDSLINVHISRSSYIVNSKGENYDLFVNLDSADVQFYEENTLIDSLYQIPLYSFDIHSVFNQGNYRSKSVFPKPGKQYKIIVKAPNLPVASSSVIIPTVVNILRVDTVGVILPIGSYFEINKGILCKIEFNDPSDETNYYLLDIRNEINKDFHSTENNIEFSCNDPIVEENLYSGDMNVGIAFSDRLINGQKCVINALIKRESIQILTSGSKQTVCFRLYSITKDFFNYIHNLNLYSKNFGNPFDDPVQVYSNIKGGYGMFSGAAVSSDSIVFPVIYH